MTNERQVLRWAKFLFWILAAISCLAEDWMGGAYAVAVVVILCVADALLPKGNIQ